MNKIGRFYGICLLFYSLSGATNIADHINTLTNNQHSRIVWIHEGDRLLGGGSLMGYDSKENTKHEILPANNNQNKPILCNGGNSIVVSIDYETYIVEWDGTGKRHLAQGICSDVWADPSTNKEWIIVRKGQNTNDGAIYRHRIDDPEDSLLLWDQSETGDAYMNWWQISADGKVAVDFLPWDRCFVIQDGGLQSNGNRIGISNGCWSSLAPDNSYYWFYFSGENGGHKALDIYKHTNHVVNLPISIDSVPDGSTEECFHPKFASKGARFLILTSGYTEQKGFYDSVEVFFGKFNSEYTQFENWIRITHNDAIDITPDAWVGIEPPAPKITLSPGNLQFQTHTDSGNPPSQNIAAATPYGTLENLSAHSNAQWLTIKVTNEHDGFMLENSIDMASLADGVHTATVTVKADNAVPSSQTYLVKLTVLGAPVASYITITPSNANITTGDSLHCSAAVLDQSNQPLEQQPPLEWNIYGTTNHDHDIPNNGLFIAGDSIGAFIIEARSGSIADSAHIFIVSKDGKPIKLRAPTEGIYEIGHSLTIRWVAGPVIKWVMAQVSPDNGGTWYDIWNKPITKWDHRFGNYRWTIPATIADASGGRVSLQSDNVRIRIVDNLDPDVYDCSPAFTIPKDITIDTPEADSTYVVGDTLWIRWKARSTVSGVVVQISPDEGKRWYSIVERAITRENDFWESYPWIINATIDDTSLASSKCKIKIYDYNHEDNDAVTAGTFTISKSIGTATSARAIHQQSVAISIRNRALHIFIPWKEPYCAALFSLKGERVFAIENKKPYTYNSYLPSGIYFLYITTEHANEKHRILMIP